MSIWPPDGPTCSLGRYWAAFSVPGILSLTAGSVPCPLEQSCSSPPPYSPKTASGDSWYMWHQFRGKGDVGHGQGVAISQIIRYKENQISFETIVIFWAQQSLKMQANVVRNCNEMLETAVKC